MFKIYDKEGREMSATHSEGEAKARMLAWPEAAYIIGEITRTVLLLREDCHPCVVSQIKDEPETKKSKDSGKASD